MSGIRNMFGDVIYQTEKIKVSDNINGVNVVCSFCNRVEHTLYFNRIYGGTFNREMLTFYLLNPEE